MPVNSFDAGLLHLLHVTARHPAGDALAARLTDFGFAIWPLLAVASLVLWRGSARSRGGVCVVLFAVFVAGQLGSTMKDIVQRPRPAATLDWVAPLGADKDDDDSSNDSFPSNHASNSFAAAGAIAWWWRRRRLIGAAAVAGAAVVAIARVYEGVHYPTDVMAGAVLGLAVGCGGAWALERHPPVSLSSEASGHPAAAPPAARLAMHPSSLACVFMVTVTALRLSLISSGDFAVSPREALQWLYPDASPVGWALESAGTAVFGRESFGIRIGYLILSTVATWSLWRLALKVSEGEVGAGLATVVLAHTAPIVAVGSWIAHPAAAATCLMVMAADALTTPTRWRVPAAALLGGAAGWASPVGWWFLIACVWLSAVRPREKADHGLTLLLFVVIAAPSLQAMRHIGPLAAPGSEWGPLLAALALGGPALWLVFVGWIRRLGMWLLAVYAFFWVFQPLATPGSVAPLWVAACIGGGARWPCPATIRLPGAWRSTRVVVTIAAVGASLAVSIWLTHPDVKRFAIPVVAPAGDPMATFGGWDKLPRKVEREIKRLGGGYIVVTDDPSLHGILRLENPERVVFWTTDDRGFSAGKFLLVAVGAKIEAPHHWRGRLRPAGEPVSFDLNRSGVLFRTVTVQPFEPAP